MIKIPKEIEFPIEDNIKPIAINKYLNNEQLLSKQITHSGWGSTAEGRPPSIRTPLMKADQEVVATGMYATNPKGGSSWARLDPKRNIRGSQQTASGNCSGDSGGN